MKHLQANGYAGLRHSDSLKSPTRLPEDPKKVIDGADPGGVTGSTGWKGGGGFRYYSLAPSLMNRDAFGNLVINASYNAEMLAEAVCKLMGYAYAPSETHYWQQGRSSESDFLYVTTSALNHEQLRAISEDVGPDRSLLICCPAFRARSDAFDNLTIRKIPQAVLARCEWGKDDYSLHVAELPDPPVPNEKVVDEDSVPPATSRSRKAKRSVMESASDLFDPEPSS